MSNCGCNSGDNCYHTSNTVQQAMLPITTNNCYGNSSELPDAPQFFQPYTTALSSTTCVTIPAVGGTFTLSNIDASKFLVGMWINVGTYGRWPIVGLNSSTNMVTLRNSCADGTTAIAGNPDPGSTICGSVPIWLTGTDPCADGESFCNSVFGCLEAISEDNPLCLPNVPAATPDQCVFAFGLSAACDSGDCPQPDDPLCLTRTNVRICDDKFVFPENLEEVTGDECYDPVVITTDGEMKRDSSASLIVVSKYKVKEIFTGDVDAAGLTAALNFTINMGDFGLPDCATGVAVRGFYQYNRGEGEVDDIEGSLFLRGDGQAPFNPANEYLRMTGGDGSAFGPITVLFGNDNKLVFFEYQDNGSVGTENQIRINFFIDYYLR